MRILVADIFCHEMAPPFYIGCEMFVLFVYVCDDSMMYTLYQHAYRSVGSERPVRRCCTCVQFQSGLHRRAHNSVNVIGCVISSRFCNKRHHLSYFNYKT